MMTLVLDWIERAANCDLQGNARRHFSAAKGCQQGPQNHGP